MQYSMAVIKVKDAEAWKQNFHCEESKAARKAAGEVSWQLLHVVGEPNTLALLNEWEDEERAMAFLQSAELRELQVASGVTEVAHVLLLDEDGKGAL